MTWYEEKEIKNEETTIKDYYHACQVLSINAGATEPQIKKAYHKLSLKYHPDKWKRKTTVGKNCKDEKCGTAFQNGINKKFFHSEECRDVYKKVSKNNELVQNAYNFLTGGNSAGDIEDDACDYCGNKCNSSTKFPKFKTGKGENEYYHFCSESCYNCLNVCDSCGKVGKIEQSEKSWEGKGWGSTRGKIFCSPACCQKLEQGTGGFGSEEKCHQCHNQLPRRCWYTEELGKGILFCSQKCISDWRKSSQNQDGQGDDDVSEPQQTNPQTNGNEGGGGNPNNNPRLNHNPHNIPNQNGEEEGDNSPNISEIPALSLIQSQAKAEQEVEKIMKDNSISKEEEKELSKEICSGENWKDYLKKLDTPAKVAEFTNKVRNFALKKKLSRQTPTQDKKPENGWVLPVIISVLSILALTTTLILIIRKRRQKKF